MTGVTPKYEFWAGNGRFKQFMEYNLNNCLEYLNLHQKWPHDGPDEVHGLTETDGALGGVFVRLAERRRNLLDYPISLQKMYKKNCIAFLDPPENE